MKKTSDKNILKGKKLSRDDVVIWNSVKKSISDQKRRIDNHNWNKEDNFYIFEYLLESFLIKDSAALNISEKTEQNSYHKNIPIFSKTTIKKFSKKTEKVSARIDLHGCNENEAYSILHNTLPQLCKRKIRNIVIVTGKGSKEKPGLFCRLVPLWLETHPFQSYIAHYEQAAEHDGGTGALYVRLKAWKEATP